MGAEWKRRCIAGRYVKRSWRTIMRAVPARVQGFEKIPREKSDPPRDRQLYR